MLSTHFPAQWPGVLLMGAVMRVFRRVILPAAWLTVFAAIAVALVKIAFVDGMAPEQAAVAPGAQVAVPVVQASFRQVESFESSDRGSGGFGSTGR